MNEINDIQQDKHPFNTRIAWENLANAIIERACFDYRTALLRLINPNIFSDIKNMSPDSIINDCERFFRSEYFMILSDVDGEYIMKRIRRELGL